MGASFKILRRKKPDKQAETASKPRKERLSFQERKKRYDKRRAELIEREERKQKQRDLENERIRKEELRLEEEQKLARQKEFHHRRRLQEQNRQVPSRSPGGLYATQSRGHIVPTQQRVQVPRRNDSELNPFAKEFVPGRRI